MLYKDYVERKVSNAIRINSAEGYPCVFDNSKGRPLKDYKLYGNSIQDGTPTPESPVEIQSVGDYTTKNLINESAITLSSGYWSDSNGNPINNSSFIRISSVKCNPNETYTLSSNLKIYSIWFFNNDTSISRTYRENMVATFKTPENCNRLRISLVNTSGNTDTIAFKWIQLELGSAATEYEPYHKYDIPVKVCGNNLLDETAFGNFKNWKSKEYGETAGGFNRFKVNCKPNTVYTVWLENQNPSIDFAWVGNRATTIQASKMWQIKSYENGCLYFRANVYNQDTLDNLINKTGNIQVIEGAYTAYTMPPYEPYHKPITTHIYLNEPLRKFKDYADYIDFKKGTVVRNVVELNLLSKQVAELYTYNGMVGIRTIPILREIMQRRGGKCNRVESSNIGYFFNKNSMWLGVNTLIIYWIGILDTLGISTLNEFKEWLDNNPTYIYYGIESSAEEDIELPKILTQKGSNIITAATAIEPSYIEVKYIEK